METTKSSILIILLLGIFCSPYQYALAQGTNSAEHEKPATQEEESPLKRWNLHVNPQGLIYSVWGGGVDLRVLKHFTLGTSFNYFDGSSNKNESGLYQAMFLIGAYWGGRSFENAWYGRIGFGHIWVVNSKKIESRDYQGSYEGYVYRTSVGRSWQIYNGVNAGAGIGASGVVGDSEYELKSDSGLSITRGSPLSKKFRPMIEAYLAFAI